MPWRISLTLLFLLIRSAIKSREYYGGRESLAKSLVQPPKVTKVILGKHNPHREKLIPITNFIACDA